MSDYTGEVHVPQSWMSVKLDVGPHFFDEPRTLPEGREPVYMRGEHDCMRGAVATALAIPYEETPNPPTSETPEATAVAFMHLWDLWANRRGLTAYFHSKRPPIDRPWWIGEVAFSRGEIDLNHSLVYWRNLLVHDPAPEATGPRPRPVRGMTFDRKYIDGQRVRDVIRAHQLGQGKEAQT